MNTQFIRMENAAVARREEFFSRIKSELCLIQACIISPLDEHRISAHGKVKALTVLISKKMMKYSNQEDVEARLLLAGQHLSIISALLDEEGWENGTAYEKLKRICDLAIRSTE